MKKCLFIFLIIALMGIVLLGCAAGKVYGKEDTAISIGTGEAFAIKLDENPATGYQWNYTISDESVIKISEDEYVADSHSENMTGAGGVRSLTFKAKAKGSAVITMVYERSWEKSEDDEKLLFNIEVS